MNSLRRIKDSLADETTRQAVILVFTVATVIAVRWAMKPDGMRTIRMRTFLTAKRVAQTQADWWQQLAGRAATAYNRERM